MHDIVVGGDVDVSGARKTRCSDLGGDDLAAQPVTVVVGVAVVHHDGDVLLDQLEHIFDGEVLAAVVTCAAEGGGHGMGALGEVLVSADGGLNGWGVEIRDVERVGEGIRLQFADVVFVSVGIDVV